MLGNLVGIVVAIVVVIGAGVVGWYAENAVIHAAGYSGFAGAGWITAMMGPLFCAMSALRFVIWAGERLAGEPGGQ